MFFIGKEFSLSSLRVIHLPFILFLTINCLGCATGRPWDSSRWAMDNPGYAEKYSKPYEKGKLESIPRRLKQMSDARFNAKRGGLTIGSGLGPNPFAIGAEIGGSIYETSWTSTNFSLAGLGLATDDGGLYGGFKIAQRIQTPSRLAPFVGAGLFVGSFNNSVSAENDGIDNNSNMFIDEPGEEKDNSKLLLTIYPEVGVHYWLTSEARLTMSAQYHLNPNGRDEDFSFIGISLGFFLNSDDDGDDGYTFEDEE